MTGSNCRPSRCKRGVSRENTTLRTITRRMNRERAKNRGAFADHLRTTFEIRRMVPCCCRYWQLGLSLERHNRNCAPPFQDQSDSDCPSARGLTVTVGDGWFDQTIRHFAPEFGRFGGSGLTKLLLEQGDGQYDGRIADSLSSQLSVKKIEEDHMFMKSDG